MNVIELMQDSSSHDDHAHRGKSQQSGDALNADDVHDQSSLVSSMSSSSTSSLSDRQPLSSTVASKNETRMRRRKRRVTTPSHPMRMMGMREPSVCNYVIDVCLQELCHDEADEEQEATEITHSLHQAQVTGVTISSSSSSSHTDVNMALMHTPPPKTLTELLQRLGTVCAQR